MSDEADRLVAEQIRYYDDRASEYEDLWFRRGRYDMGPDFNDGWFRETAIVEAAVDVFDVGSSLLEVACGSGIWTRRLAPRAGRLVAVDSSSRMIELNRGRFGAANVTYVHADLFAWEPSERFDSALTGFFISHIPPDRFARFWERLATWLQPGGRLFLIEDAAAPGRPYSGDVVDDGPAFAHRRRLADGREYTIVKRFFVPEELTATLDALGWDADIRSSGEHLVYGTAWPR